MRPWNVYGNKGMRPRIVRYIGSSTLTKRVCQKSSCCVHTSQSAMAIAILVLMESIVRLKLLSKCEY